MKTIKFYAIIAALAFASVSCVENSTKYKTAIAQRDSLAMEKQVSDSNYIQTLDILNEIEAGFSEINQKEDEMNVNLKGVEGANSDKRQVIGAQMRAIKEGIELNKAKIEELKRMSAKSGKANVLLSNTIKRLEAELTEQAMLIKNLQGELDKRNILISELNTTVSNQSKNIQEQQSAMELQKSTIETQDKNMNIVWYCLGSSKKLKEAKIISTSGLFNTKKGMGKDFDQSAFTQVDMRTITSIPTNSKSIKFISSHPVSSYSLVIGDDKNITIEITNQSKFWSVSKYLVVQI